MKFRNQRQHKQPTVPPEERAEKMCAFDRVQTRKALFRRESRCCWCHRQLIMETATIEHVRPLSRGGSNDIDNLRLACEPCNKRRGSKHTVPNAIAKTPTRGEGTR